MLGQVALTASVDSCLANHIAAMWSIYNGHVFSQEELLLCYTGAALQSLSCRLLLSLPRPFCMYGQSLCPACASPCPQI